MHHHDQLHMSGVDLKKLQQQKLLSDNNKTK